MIGAVAHWTARLMTYGIARTVVSVTIGQRSKAMKAYLVLVDGKVSQEAYLTPEQAIDYIMSRPHPIINGDDWNFKAYDKDGTITYYQITDVTVKAVQ